MITVNMNHQTNCLSKRLFYKHLKVEHSKYVSLNDRNSLLASKLYISLQHSVLKSPLLIAQEQYLAVTTRAVEQISASLLCNQSPPTLHSANSVKQ